MKARRPAGGRFRHLVLAAGLFALATSTFPMSAQGGQGDVQGEVVLLGSPEVGGQVLAYVAGTTDPIDDPDGINTATFTYQWIVEDAGGTQTDISGATDSSYTLTANEAGKFVRVRVSFMDDNGNNEAVVSPRFPSLVPIRANPLPDTTCNVPDFTGRTEVLSGELTVGLLASSIEDTIFYGWSSRTLPGGGSLRVGNFGSRDTRKFSIGETNYSVVRSISQYSIGSGGGERFNISIRPQLGAAHHAELRVHVCDESFDVGDFTFEAIISGLPYTPYTWHHTGLDWQNHGKRTLYLSVDSPVFELASVNGATLKLVYSEALDTTAPAAGAYSVKVDGGTAVSPSSVSIDGRTVTLTLATAVTGSQTVTLTYVQPDANPVQDAGGAMVYSFTDRSVVNNTGNSAPTLDNAIPDQTAAVGEAFSYRIPASTFSDADNDTLNYRAARSDGASLPSWLAFDPSTRTFSGTPAAADFGTTVTVKVTADDGKAEFVSDEFDIGVRSGDFESASNDATLGALALEDGVGAAVPLAPAFAADEVRYWASVGYSVSQVTVTATPGDAGATVEWFDADNRTLDDADGDEDGFQVDLGVGFTAFTVQVTAADSMTVRRYAVTVMRAPAPMGSLVSNLNQPNYPNDYEIPLAEDADGPGDNINILVGKAGDGSLHNPSRNRVPAIGFDTGDSTDGYTLSSVVIPFGNSDSLVNDVRVSIYTATSDESPVPDSSLFVFSNPSSINSENLITFTAPANAILEPEKRYFVVVEALNENAFHIRGTFSTHEDPGGVSGWSINNRSYHQGERDSDTMDIDWGNLRTTLLKFAINGRSIVRVRDATGAPSISGLPQVGVQLVAGIGTMADLDGLPAFPSSFDFQWVRVSGGTESDIVGATSQTYTPVAADAGSMLKVKASFSDGENGSEMLTSAATEAVLAAPEDCAADRLNNDWCTTMTVGKGPSGDPAQEYGYHLGRGFGSLDAATFDYGGRTWTVSVLNQSDFNYAGQLQLDVILNAHAPLGSVFDVGGTEFTVADGNVSGLVDGKHFWDTSLLSWLKGQKVTVSANLAPDLVGARVNGATMVLIFAEDLDAGSVPAAGAFTVKRTLSGGGETTVEVRGTPSISGRTVTLTLGSAVVFDDEDVRVSYTQPSSNPLQDESGLDAPEFTDEEVTNNSSATNTPATGAPSIDGTPQVGQTLTAQQGDMDDDNLLPVTDFPAGYTFQWVRVSGGLETDISGEISRTYTPVAADAGSTIKVKVSFTDGAGYAEELTSAATAAVLAAPEDCADRTGADWCATMTVGVNLHPAFTWTGFAGGENVGTLDDTTIEYGASRTYTVEFIWLHEAIESFPSDNDGVYLEVDAFVGRGGVFDLGGTDFTASESSETTVAGRYSWSIPSGFSWLDGQKVTVSANLAPDPVSATVDGTSLVLTFVEDLDANSIPAAGAFTVEKTPSGGTETTVTVSGTPAFSGKTVTLTLAAAVVSTDTVTVSYANPNTNPLRDASGIEAPGFADYEVINNTGVVNTPAGGMPAIDGTPQVGQTLTAQGGGIYDADGLPDTFPVGYGFQWLRVNGATETAIAGATSHTYGPEDADVGAVLKVKMSFIDDRGYAEELTSAATAAVRAAPQACSARAGADWCTTMTVGEDVGLYVSDYGYVADQGLGAQGALDDDGIEYGGETYRVGSIRFVTVTGGTDYVGVSFDAGVPGGSVFNLGGTEFAAPVSGGKDSKEGEYQWDYAAGFDWLDGQKVTVSVNIPPALSRAVVDVTTLMLTFAEDLDTDSVPAADAFTVKWTPSGDSEETVAVSGSPKVSGRTLTLTLAAAVAPKDLVTVSYAQPSVDPLRDLSGLEATSFADVKVTNTTTRNKPPDFGYGRKEIVMASRSMPAGTAIGEPLTATDPNGDTLTYSLEPGGYYAERNVQLFTIDEGTGQLRAGALMDTMMSWAGYPRAEAGEKETYVAGLGVYVRADDGRGGTDRVYVEAIRPKLPADAPDNVSCTSAPVQGDGTKLAATCRMRQPQSGNKPVTHVELRYTETAAGAWAISKPVPLMEPDPVDIGPAGSGHILHEFEVEVGGLEPGTEYVIGGRAFNADGPGEWGSGSLATTSGVALATASQVQALTGSFEDAPASHDGQTAFTLRLSLSAPVENTAADLRDHAVQVTGGSVESVGKVDGRADLWAVTVTPDGTGAVTVSVAAAGSCGDAGTLCTAEGEALSATATATVAGPGGTATPRGTATPLRASFANLPNEHDGSTQFSVGIEFSEAPAGMKNGDILRVVQVTGGTKRGMRRVNESLTHRTLAIDPDGYGPVTVTLPATADCQDADALCTASGGRLEVGIAMKIQGPVAISVADARVDEGPDAELEFAVTLDRARDDTVRVDYATEDRNATAGADYTAVSGTLTFAAGETSKKVAVPVLNDALDDGGETMVLRLSNPVGAWIEDGEAIGTIENDDAMPQAWLARFGRTVADQVLEAVASRAAKPRGPGTEISLAGQRLGNLSAEERRRLESRLSGPEGSGNRFGGERGLTLRELLAGSSFSLTGGTADTGFGAVWGRGASSGFSGRGGDGLTLDGDVESLLLGADYRHGGTAYGLLLSHSLGEGKYRTTMAGGAMESVLTGLYPWVRYSVSERLSVWGAGGYGSGTLTLTPEGHGAIGTDLELAMLAGGLRGELLGPGHGGRSLAAKADWLGVRTTSAGARTPEGGLLNGADATVTRVRVGLEGSMALRLDGSGGVLRPMLELGLRHDAGDAESGFGVDVGLGLLWAVPDMGLAVELRGRGLATHESEGFEEEGYWGFLAWDPSPGTDRGFSLEVSRSVGAQATGGVEELFGRDSLGGFRSLGDAGDDGNARLETKVGYGFPAFGGRYTATPSLGYGQWDSGRDLLLGVRLARTLSTGIRFGMDVEGQRSEGGSDGTGHGLGVGFEWRRESAVLSGVSFGFRVEGSRRDEGGEEPEHVLGVSLEAAW